MACSPWRKINATDYFNPSETTSLHGVTERNKARGKDGKGAIKRRGKERGAGRPVLTEADRKTEIQRPKEIVTKTTDK